MLKKIAYSVGGGIFLGFFPIAFLITALCTGDEKSLVVAFSFLATASFGTGFLCTMLSFLKHKTQLER